MSHTKTVSNWDLQVFHAPNTKAVTLGDSISFIYNGKVRNGNVERIGKSGNKIVVTVNMGAETKNFFAGNMGSLRVIQSV